MTIRSIISSPVKGVIGGNSSTTSFSRLLSLLRSKGGQLYMAGPANREASDGSGTAPDGIGTDPIGHVRNLAAEELGPELLIGTSGEFSTGVSYADGVVTAVNCPTGEGMSLYIPSGKSNFRMLEIRYTLESVSGSGLAPIMYGDGYYAMLTVRTTPGTYTERVMVTTAGGSFASAFRPRAFSGAAASFILRNISVREVRAATQTTTAAKPLLRREPILGPELVVNGDFSAGTTGWSVTDGTQGSIVVTSGGLVVTVTVNIAGGIQSLSTVPGKTYQLVGQMRRDTCADVRFRAAANTFAGTILGETVVGTSAAMQQATVTFIATSSTTVVYARANGAGTAIFDNVSCREILGYKDVWYWEFDGVDDFTRGAVSPITGAPGALICVALAPLRALPKNDTYLTNKAAGGSGGGTMFIVGEPARVAFSLGDGVDMVYLFDTAPYGAALGAWRVYTLWRDGNTLRLRKDGVELQAGSVAAVDAFTPDRALILGGNWNGTITYNPGNCRIQAPVISQGITTLAEVQQIEREVARLAGVALQ